MSALTEAQRADIEQRVDDGVWFLDHVMPRWADRVDLSKLDMTAWAADVGCGCIAMQVTGQRYYFPEATDALGIARRFPSGADLGLTALGDGPTGRPEYGRDGWAYAHELWQEAVLDRRPNKLIGGERIPVPA
jgi:hypothetical protein